MITAQRTLEIDATPQQVWAVFGRFMHIDEFHPRVTRVDALTDGKTGVGATRRCHFKDGSSAVEKVVAWEEGASYQVQLSEFSMPLTKLFMRLAAAPSAGNRTLVTMELQYQVKFGPLGWLMGKTMMASMMGKMMQLVLGGLQARVAATRAV